MFHKVRLFGLIAILAFGVQTASVTAAETEVRQGGAPLKYEEPRRLTGAIYGQDSGHRTLLFKFLREATRSGDRLNVQRDFLYPDGRLAAQEHVIYDGDQLSLYELKDLQGGATGSARIRRSAETTGNGSIEFTYSPAPGKRLKARSEALAQDTLIADMVGPFLAAHWQALLQGEKVRCRYIVVPRRETVGFTFMRAPGKPADDRVLVVKMQASSPLIAALLEPLFFTIEKAAPHRVLQYSGRTTPKIQLDGKWKDLDALTVFDWESGR